MIYELEQVSFAYEADAPALEAISFAAAPGERVAILGANGSGKSTLMRLLDALSFPTSGTMAFAGLPVTEQAFAEDAVNHAFRKRVGLVFQNPDIQLFSATVFDELAFGPLQLGWSRSRILDSVERTLALFGVEGLRGRQPHRLSGGEKKRVALAATLITEPDVLLLDEPTTALDPESRTTFVDLLCSPRTDGRTIFIATHDLDIAEAVTTRTIILDRGRIAADGPTRLLLRDMDLLRRTHLLRSHWHAGPDGRPIAHAHPHGH